MQQRLSPRQVRLVRLLEMSEPEMEEEVRRQLDDNPALTEADNHLTDGSDAPHADDSHAETAEQLQRADYLDEDDIPFYRQNISNTSADDSHYEPTAIASDETLGESLERQLAELPLSDRQITLGRYIIGNIDDNGYMTRSPLQLEDDLAIDAGIEVEPHELAEMIERVRSLDPPGVGAVDLRDSLLLQLQRMSADTPGLKVATEIVRDYFDLFSMRHFDRLESAMNIDRDTLREAEALIRTLDPKPGSRIGGSDADDRLRHITPDFLVETDDNSRVSVSMPSRLPALAIESSFDVADSPESVTADTVPSGASARRAQALEFVTRKRDDANEFIDLVKTRRSTLMKVMEAIVRYQKVFFLTDDETRIRPMVLRDISAMTGLDLSMISRATSGKYVATARGVYPLKFFFNERLSDQEDASTHEINDVLRGLIDREDPSSPLSDDALTEQLNAMGYNIARRTVAKYRERLGLPVARLRRRL